jgi:protein-S-isoprenylcysteine O-methyltransferase Ste14
VSLIVWTGAAMFLLSLLHFLWRYFVTFGAPAPADTGYSGVAVNFGLFTVFAMHHSLLARTRAKAWINDIFASEVERTVYVWVASLLFVGVAALWQPVPGTIWNLSGTAAVMAWAGQIAGVVFTAWSARSLGILELAGIRPPAQSAAPVELRTDGPYGFVRHPIYFAWLLLVWSVPLMNGTRLSFAIISTLYLAVAVPFEERSLVALFGPSYTRYQKKVRWRMLPLVY